MIRKIAYLVVLTIATAIVWLLDQTYGGYWADGGFYTLLALTIIYLVFSLLIDETFSNRIKDSKTRYSFKKTVSILQMAVIAIVLVLIWIQDSQALLVSYGVIGAGVAIALQDVFRNFAGGVIIFVSGVYKTGDRVEIEETMGDVIDIGIMYTTLLEIRAWVGGDQATGRLAIIPNGKVIGKGVFNYSKDHGYLWDELTFPIAYDSDWREANDIILRIAREETADYAQKAEEDIERIGEKYYIPRVDLEPNVFITLTSNWVQMTIRYVIPVRARRPISNKISQRILDEIEKSEKVRIASESIEVNRLPSTDTAPR